MDVGLPLSRGQLWSKYVYLEFLEMGTQWHVREGDALSFILLVWNIIKDSDEDRPQECVIY